MKHKKKKSKIRKPKWKKELAKKQRKIIDKTHCVSCGTHKKLTIHHIIPKSLGGKNNKRNLIVLCTKCHKDEHVDNNKKFWSDNDLYLLMWMKNNEYDYKHISEVLKRSLSSCQTMAHNCKLRVDNASVKLRNNSLLNT